MSKKKAHSMDMNSASRYDKSYLTGLPFKGIGYRKRGHVHLNHPALTTESSVFERAILYGHRQEAELVLACSHYFTEKVAPLEPLAGESLDLEDLLFLKSFLPDATITNYAKMDGMSLFEKRKTLGSVYERDKKAVELGSGWFRYLFESLQDAQIFCQEQPETVEDTKESTENGRLVVQNCSTLQLRLSAHQSDLQVKDSTVKAFQFKGCQSHMNDFGHIWHDLKALCCLAG